MKKTFELDEKLIAFCVDADMEECVTPDGPGYYLECLKLLDLTITEGDGEKKSRYVVTYDINEYDCGGNLPPKWEFSTPDFTLAYNKFKEESGKSFWSKVFLCDRFKLDYGCLYDDGTPGYRSSTNGDYGASDPWNAPGMKISDFLPGVG